MYCHLWFFWFVFIPHTPMSSAVVWYQCKHVDDNVSGWHSIKLCHFTMFVKIHLTSCTSTHFCWNDLHQTPKEIFYCRFHLIFLSAFCNKVQSFLWESLTLWPIEAIRINFPNKITFESTNKVTRKWETITNQRCCWLLIKFSLSAP